MIAESTIGTSDNQTQMAWSVPDIRTAIADLHARGVRIDELNHRSPRGSASPTFCEHLDGLRDAY